jgi:hypothetical protein
MEKYIKIKKFDNYEVSNLGNVRNIKTGRVLIQNIETRGYYKVCLYKNNKSYTIRTHRLVASEHVANPNNFTEVDHIDRNKLNNNSSNLRWVSKRGNLKNSMFCKNPYITFNYVKKNFLVYNPILHQYFEYGIIDDATRKFLSLI